MDKEPLPPTPLNGAAATEPDEAEVLAGLYGQADEDSR